MKSKKLLILFVSAIAASSVTSCSTPGGQGGNSSGLSSSSSNFSDSLDSPNEDTANSFYISSSSDTYYLELQNKIKLEVSKDKVVSNTDGVVEFYISSDNTIGAKITNNEFTATSIGSVTIKARRNGKESANEINIKSEYYSQGKDQYFKKTIEDSSLSLGCSYDVGLSQSEASNYSIVKGGDYFRFDDTGKLEVIGFGKGEFQVNCGSRTVYEHDFSAGGSVLCAEIRSSLYEKGLIDSKTANVPYNLLTNITELNLSGKLINDPNAKYGVSLLKNLENIDLSYNDIDDASFINGLSKLKNVNLSNNFISHIDYLYESRHSIESMDLSNNLIVSLSNLKYFSVIKSLDLSYNLITNIQFLSELTTLKSLFLNGNEIGSFTDPLANLFNLEELGLGYCNLAFVNIKSFNYLENLTYLDISETSTKLDDLKSYTKLESLLMSDCSLYNDDLTKLNNFVNLKYLDISNNLLTESNVNNVIQPTTLSNIEHLSIGGNEFDKAPSCIKEFPKLEVLDLTNSYNLTSLESLKGLAVKTLILDECASIGGHYAKNTDYCEEFINVIDTLTNLEKLSLISGLNFMNKTLYDNLTTRVAEGSLSLRLLNDNYEDENTFRSYNSSIYFSLAELLSSCTYNAGAGLYELPLTERHIILSLVNDNSNESTTKYDFSVPKNVRIFDMYGNKYKTYNMSFVVTERKNSSLSLNIADFVNRISRTFIKAADGSKTYIKAFNNVAITTSDFQDSAMRLYDSRITTANAKSSFKATAAEGYGGHGDEHDERGVHNEGYDGQICLYCHSFYGDGNVTLIGGKGGTGSRGIGGVWVGQTGTGGFNGGTGGSAVSYSTSGTCAYTSTVKLIAGEGGEGGAAGSNSGSKGPGKKGKDGTPVVTH